MSDIDGLTAEQKAARAAQFERDLLVFDRTAFQSFASFEEADEADRQYWRSRTPEERMKALEHIRQLAWGYDEESQPVLQRSDLVLEQRRG